MRTQPKAKKCRACGDPFTPMSSLTKACSVPCAIDMVEQRKDKAFKAETRRRKAAIKSRAQWIKETQAEFNKYIRARDHDQPCVSCGRHHDGQYHAGHYLSTGSNPELRFNEINCHKQCAPCNNHLSGNIPNYRPALIDKIGLPLVEWLEGPHKPLKPTIDELKWLKTYYQQRAKEAAQWQ